MHLIGKQKRNVANADPKWDVHADHKVSAKVEDDDDEARNIGFIGIMGEFNLGDEPIFNFQEQNDQNNINWHHEARRHMMRSKIPVCVLCLEICMKCVMCVMGITNGDIMVLFGTTITGIIMGFMSGFVFEKFLEFTINVDYVKETVRHMIRLRPNDFDEDPLIIVRRIIRRHDFFVDAITSGLIVGLTIGIWGEFYGGGALTGILIGIIISAFGSYIKYRRLKEVAAGSIIILTTFMSFIGFGCGLVLGWIKK